jgi:TrmH family RNA methyltransferase
LKSDFALKLVAEQEARGVPCYPVAARVFESIAEKENPQGLLAVVNTRAPHLEQLSPDNFAWGAALVSPQDPGNLGTILRTIDAVGASGLLLLNGGVDPYHPAAVRASMGALFWRPIASASFDEFVRWTRQHSYRIYGTSAHADQDYQSLPACTPPFILLLGSERQGLTPEQTAACDVLLSLPMHGRVTSLNLAVAAGVMLYAMLDKIQPGRI